MERFASTALAVLIAALPALVGAGERGAGTEGRMWVDGPSAPPLSAVRYPVTVEDNVKIAMRDGVILDARVLVPTLTEGAGACVLLANGYGRGGSSGSRIEPPLRDLAERGYAAVHVSLRGSGESGGTNDLYNRYGEDGYDVVEWMAEQPWCDGNVGMVGGSLMGISQLLTASQLPPHLRAIIPHVACGDCYDVLWYPGGMLPGPGRVARGEPEYPATIQHRDFDDWWRARVTLAEDHRRMARNGIAALITGGWDDYLTPASIRAYEEYRSLAGTRKKLIVGPWAHGGAPGLEPYDFQSFQVLWLGRWLAGERNGIAEGPKALIYVKGPDRWRYEEDWPIRDAQPVELFLSAKRSGTIDSPNDGSLLEQSPPRTSPGVSYRYSVDAPLLPTMLSSSGRLGIDQSSEEAGALTWTSDPLEVSTEVTGWPRLNLWVSSSGGDFDLVAQITDVAADGTSVQVVAGYLNAPRYFSRTNPEPLVTGKVYEIRMKILPTAYVFPVGHRIRLDIAGGSKVVEGQERPQGPRANPNPATVTVYQDARRPSRIELPIVGTGWRQWTAGRSEH